MHGIALHSDVCWYYAEWVGWAIVGIIVVAVAVLAIKKH